MPEFKLSTVQLLGAQALDGARIAMIVQIDDKLLGGVAYQTDLTCEFRHMELITSMNFRWLWWKYVDSVDQFYRDRVWEQQPKLGYPAALLVSTTTRI